jgi:hypothetical protein
LIERRIALDLKDVLLEQQRRAQEHSLAPSTSMRVETRNFTFGVSLAVAIQYSVGLWMTSFSLWKR